MKYRPLGNRDKKPDNKLTVIILDFYKIHRKINVLKYITYT